MAVGLASATAAMADWTFWRGPGWDGASDDTGLPSSWSPDGEGLAWRVDFVGRSTPVVFDGRVCAIGRFGEKETVRQQERIACFDARDGSLLWDHRYSVRNTTVPFNRVGWASLAADPETGYVYSHGAAGDLIAFDRDGGIAWSYFLPEFNGRMSGYGGRTQTPLVYGDLLILSYVSIGWGELGPPKHRFWAHDKRTGELVWVTSGVGRVYDMNTQGGPVVAEIEGRPMLIGGGADGRVYGIDVATGEIVWHFELSKRGINVHPVVRGGVVYISHSEENIDAAVMGRIVAIDATGTGDVTQTHEVWRLDEVQAGFPSPAYHDGKLYHVDNSANLHRIDATTGEIEWTHNLGTVGKGSPVWADGKLYVSEVNGRFHILKPGKDGCEPLDLDELEVPGGRYAEIYGSPAIAYGRVFFATEGGLYALGGKSKKVKIEKASRKPAKRGAAVGLHVVPAEILTGPGEPVDVRVVGLTADGRLVDGPRATWTVDGFRGEVSGGKLVADPEVAFQTGKVVARSGDRNVTARVRVIGPLPWSEEFEAYDDGYTPPHWISAAGKFSVKTLEDGNKVLAQPPRARGLQRSFTYLGRPEWNNYTIQADVRSAPHRRRRADIGLRAGGYTLDLKGAKQELEIRSWTAELRMAKQTPFAWEMDTWYTMKMRVDQGREKAVVRGKVWKRGDPEPEEWTLVAEDPYPVPEGGPGIVGYAPVEIQYDNLEVRVNP